MNVLYIGSGNSALQCKNIDTSKYIIACANNAFRLFDSFDIWICSGDFRSSNYPSRKKYLTYISRNEYSNHVNEISKKLNWDTDSPQHHAGYTIFFQGLYSLMNIPNFTNIYTLGFDHDYNMEKYNKWKSLDYPNPQNKYHGLNMSEVFSEFEQDSFYGKESTPDPLRYGIGTDHLIEKFKFAKENAKKLNINLYNASRSYSKINSFKRVPVLP